MGKYQVGGVHTLTGEGRRFVISANDESAALDTVRDAGFAPTSVQIEVERGRPAYEYETVSLTPRLMTADANDLARQLKIVISDMADADWEYLRTDHFQLPRRRGLLSRFVGGSTNGDHAYVLTFRRPLQDRPHPADDSCQEPHQPR